MNKTNGRIALFLALMLLLASGLSYLSFSSKTKEKEAPKAAKVMSVALVNEDEGTDFNHDRIGFGNAFVKSIERDDRHEWSVVSRGVAENGLKKNLYNMMVIIPHDFSEKAVAIDKENPDPVALPYKINATGSENAKAEAEKAASQILNDFNKRVIDVYFASIVGNLQEAQDNVGSIVRKGEKYTNTYNQSVQSPLASYTDQFKLVKDYTKQSKDYFGTFQDGLTSFEKQMEADLNVKRAQLPGIEQALEMKQGNQLLYLDYFTKLNMLNQDVFADPVGQMKLTELQNQRILDRLQGKADDPAAGMAVNVENIKNYLQQRREKVQGLDKLLKDTVNEGIEKKVEKQLSASFDKAFAEEGMNLSLLFADPDKKAKRLIQRHIDRLPTLSFDQIHASGLSKETENRIKNTIAVTKQYNQDFGYTGGGNGEIHLLPEQIEKIKQKLATEGLNVSDQVAIAQNQNGGQTIQLITPAGFTATYFAATLPGGQQMSTSGTTMTLPENAAGQLKVQATFKLNDANQDIDIFTPVEWGWTLEQKDTENAQVQAAAKKAKKASIKTEDMSTANQHIIFQRLNTEGAENEADEADATEEQDAADTEQGSTPTKEEQDRKIKEAKEPKSTETDKSKEKAPTDKTPEQTEPLEINNNIIRHKVMTPLFDEDADDVINNAVDGLHTYEQLAALYENYFGLDMDKTNIADAWKGKELQYAATDSSLYYLFNKKDIGTLFKNYAISKISDDLAEGIRKPMDKLASEMDQYHQFVQQTDDQAAQLAEKIQAATAEALGVNADLSQLMADAAAWREKSLALLDEQSQVEQANEAEQAAMMQMDSGFRDILGSSESVVSQSALHRTTAETVYSTFARIDDQATNIQNSGKGLVQKAKDLSKNMTDKVLKDKAFAYNFKNVLANSRVGDRPNENLFDFLSNPVQTKNSGTIFKDDQAKRDAIVPTYLVLIAFITALFTAYAISTLRSRKQPTADQFESGEVPLFKINLPIAAITAGVGLLEGLLMGVSSAYYLNAEPSEAVVWTLAVMLVMSALVLVATYLLRQLKMIGMFILLAIFSVYLLFASGSSGAAALSSTIQQFSPLDYIQDYAGLLASGADDTWKFTLVLSVLAIAGAAANLFVKTKTDRVQTEDENTHQAG